MIYDLLASSTFLIVARLVLTSFFWIAGVVYLVKFRDMAGVIAAHGLPAPRLVTVMIAVTCLLGSALVITDFRSTGWLGAGALGIFTFLSIPLGHPFWKFPQPRRMEEFQVALEHIAVIGGLMCAAILTLR
ncbi:DoxX family membrane protein [Pararoseomonas sp. SCSIO 73927]|uniref:DoxX family protein n=1 Tax=Pararoseomonas sp. SCSIO 73927 TaxID=3114537 RepID=UPI0030D20B75